MLGAQLTDQMLSAKWIARRGKTRGVRVTEAGRRAFAKLGLAVEVIESARKRALRGRLRGGPIFAIVPASRVIQ